MKHIYIFAIILVLFLTTCSYALQTSYIYVGFTYFRGLYPFLQVVEGGKTGVCGCPPTNSNLENPDLGCAMPCLKMYEDQPYLNSRYYKTKSVLDWSPGPVEGYTGFGAQITVPEDYKLVKSDGSLVGDELCLGEQFRVVSGNSKGEFWQDGGVCDSPPIEWVEDMDVVFEKVIDNADPNNLLRFYSDRGVPSGWGSKAPADGFVDPVTGVKVYNMMVGGTSEITGYLDPLIPWTGSLICSLKSRAVQADNLKQTGDSYTPTALGSLNISAISDVECMYLLLGVQEAGYGFYTIWKPYVLQTGPNIDVAYNGMDQSIRYDSKSDFFKIGTIGINKTIRVVSSELPKVEVSVAGADNIKFGESNTLRVLVKNTGDVNVSLKSVNSRPLGKTISCDSGVLSPGKEGECLLSVTPQSGEGLSVQVSYDYKSCGKAQVGLASKVLLGSKIVLPVLSEQVYSMAVHGGCENSYYSCNEAKTQPALFAGYKCYKTSNGFYTPATERFNLRFNLSDSIVSTIASARLHLPVSEVGKTQTVEIYSIDSMPDAVKCVAGGDICTKPYCGECKPLYDLGGTKISSAPISSGDYSFDVSHIVKEKAASAGTVSLQIRGLEGLWDTDKENSCSLENNWDKRDISFTAGADGPYLEITYN